MKEHWIEVNIFLKNEGEAEKFLLSFIKPLMDTADDHVVTWHYFFEPNIRFRVRLNDEEAKKYWKQMLSDWLPKTELVQAFKFGCHGGEGEYEGEEADYGGAGWQFTQKYFEYGAKTALAMFSNKGISKSFGFHASRYIHLFLNQIGWNDFKQWMKKFFLNEIIFHMEQVVGYLQHQEFYMHQTKHPYHEQMKIIVADARKLLDALHKFEKV